MGLGVGKTFVPLNTTTGPPDDMKRSDPSDATTAVEDKRDTAPSVCDEEEDEEELPGTATACHFFCPV